MRTLWDPRHPRFDSTTTLPSVVCQRASESPNRIFVRQVSGPDLTYAEVDEQARRWASALRQLGVAPGDRVATMLPPSADSLTLWLGIAQLGAIDTGINTDFKGYLLSYVLDVAEVEVLVTTATYRPVIDEIVPDLRRLRCVVVLGGGPGPQSGLASFRADDLLAASEPAESRAPEQWDIACLTFTSGTTGPSKGVMIPWGQLYVFSTLLFKIEDLDQSDVFLSPWPAYHTSGRFGAYMMALLGGQIVYKDKFQLSTWLDEVRRFGVTSMILWPPMIDLLRTTVIADIGGPLPLRNVGGQWPPDHAELAERYGLRMRSCFGMTEVPTIILSEGWKIDNHRSIGKLHQGFPGFEARLVDEHDREVPAGESGELIVRSATPWTMNLGYFNDPGATAKAWINGWFHTGDLLQCDQEGNFSFVDRTTDSIRRRGENISSSEVEAYISVHPEVIECAAVAVSAPEHYDQEVKAVVVRKPGSTLDADGLHTYLSRQMPRFMIPRYIEFVDALPRTESTLKVRKVELREEPLNDRTWDSQVLHDAAVPAAAP